MAKRVSDEDKQRAQALFALGKSFREIASDLDGRVSPAWISKQARDEGWLRGVLPERLVTPDTPQIFESANATADEVAANNAKLSAVQKRRWIDQKAGLADRLGEKIGVLLDQMFLPVTLKEVKVAGGVVEIVEVPLSEPPPSDKARLATALAILVDKASLLAGDATSRVETASLSKEQAQERLGFLRSEFEERLERRRAEAEKKTGAQTG